MAVIGIIGGSGLDDPEILEDATDVDVETPYGRPSSPLPSRSSICHAAAGGWTPAAVRACRRYPWPGRWGRLGA